MTSATVESRIRGCVLGMALGDAIGGPFEFGPLERVPALTGGTWIDGLYPPKALFDRIVSLDPLHLGGEFSELYVKAHLPRFYPLVAKARSDREAAHALSLVFRRDHPFDPLRTLGTALLSVLAANADPLRAILIAANHVGIDEEGQATRYEDTDCYGAIAGAIAGALSGAEAFPPGILEQVVESNKTVYGIDLEASITRLCERFL